jgi:Ni/Fe-hydrogenase 1 B-type cytochrome subunit
MTKKVYVWEIPVRATHWVNVLSIAALSITGLYIANPYMQASSENSFIMASMRFIHFLGSYIFIASILVRMYWWFAGNKYARLNQFLPVTGERCRNLAGTAQFYCFLKDDMPEYAGHTGLAGITYVVLFIIFLLEIFTGFALYSQSHAGGGLWSIGTWLLSFYSAMGLRLVHHLLMWFIFAFVIFHVYISTHNHLIEKNGLIMSIFTGYKTVRED